MKTWVISDQHFSHKNIITFENRPFSSIEEMNEAMTAAHNSVVAEDDLVYMLGDVSFHKQEAYKQVAALNGRKVLIRGNHDNTRDKRFTEQFESVHDYLKVKVNGVDVVMFHYPIYEWDKMHYGAVHLHGHVHGKPTGIDGRIFDVWAGGNFFKPYSLEQLVDDLVLTPDIRPHGSVPAQRKTPTLNLA